MTEPWALLSALALGVVVVMVVILVPTWVLDHLDRVAMVRSRAEADAIAGGGVFTWVEPQPFRARVAGWYCRFYSASRPLNRVQALWRPTRRWAVAATLRKISPPPFDRSPS